MVLKFASGRVIFATGLAIVLLLGGFPVSAQTKAGTQTKTSTRKSGEYTVKETVRTTKNEHGVDILSEEVWTNAGGVEVKKVYGLSHKDADGQIKMDSRITKEFDALGNSTVTSEYTKFSGDQIVTGKRTEKLDANGNLLTGEKTTTVRNKKTGEKKVTHQTYNPRTERWEDPATTVAQGGSGWLATAAALFGEIGSRFAFQCPAGGTIYLVWGSGTYTDDSSVCSAAVHAGLITVTSGGTVTIELRAGQNAYSASKQNGVESITWGEWSRSFVFVP